MHISEIIVELSNRSWGDILQDMKNETLNILIMTVKDEIIIFIIKEDD
jgi:hypothetical protein